MTTDPWPSELAKSIAAEVRRLRKAQGMSTQDLSDACAALGLPIARSVLANFETGRRATVSVAELLVLGRALGVPPALLIFPLGYERSVEVLPDQAWRTWEALKWFTGENRLPTKSDGVWRMAPTALSNPPSLQVWDLYHAHEWNVEQWRDAVRRAAEVRTEAANPRAAANERALIAWAELQEADVARIEEWLRAQRAKMRELGASPPPLPQELVHIDEMRG